MAYGSEVLQERIEDRLNPAELVRRLRLNFP